MKHYFILILFVMTTQFLNAQITNDFNQWLEAVEDEKALNWEKNGMRNRLKLFRTILITKRFTIKTWRL